MRVSFSISVKSGVKTDRWSDKYTDEGKSAVPTEQILELTAERLRGWLKQIERDHSELKNKNSSLDEHF